MSALNILPEEIQLQILGLLTGNDLERYLRAMQLSGDTERMSEIAETESLWRRCVKHEFPISYDRIVLNQPDWNQLNPNGRFWRLQFHLLTTCKNLNARYYKAIEEKSPQTLSNDIIMFGSLVPQEDLFYKTMFMQLEAMGWSFSFGSQWNDRCFNFR